MRFVNNDFQENKEPTIGGPSPPAFTMLSDQNNSGLPDAKVQPAYAHDKVRDLGHGGAGSVSIPHSSYAAAQQRTIATQLAVRCYCHAQHGGGCG